MPLTRLISFTKLLEDPECPLLGPNLKALYVFGLWQTGSRFRTIVFNIFHFLSLLFVGTLFIDLYMSRQDLNEALINFSLTTLSFVSYAKLLSFLLCQKRWAILIKNISQEELNELRNNKSTTLGRMQNYTKYSRIITYSYWVMTAVSGLGLIVTPLIRYLTTPNYKENIDSGIEPLPRIIHSWFPFDQLKMPGYAYACIIQIVMALQGSAIIGAYDTISIAIMTFLKGHLIILQNMCKDIFKGNGNEDFYELVERIKECHRRHNFLIEQYKLFNNLLSPVMFIYVLVCSVTICCSVVQYISNETTASQKFWVVQYTSGQIFQLFAYCWHANEVYVQSKEVDRGVFASDWWKADVRLRKLILLLACKLDYPLCMSAGPFTDLSLTTFVNILRGSYSFFTLFTQMQGY